MGRFRKKTIGFTVKALLDWGIKNGKTEKSALADAKFLLKKRVIFPVDTSYTQWADGPWNPKGIYQLYSAVSLASDSQTDPFAVNIVQRFTRKARPGPVVAEEMQRLTGAMSDKFITKDGLGVDYSGLDESDIFIRLRPANTHSF